MQLFLILHLKNFVQRINDDPQECENNANYMKLKGSATVLCSKMVNGLWVILIKNRVIPWIFYRYNTVLRIYLLSKYIKIKKTGLQYDFLYYIWTNHSVFICYINSILASKYTNRKIRKTELIYICGSLIGSKLGSSSANAGERLWETQQRRSIHMACYLEPESYHSIL